MFDARSYQKKRRDEWRDAGLCVQCGKEAEEGKSRCRTCLDYQAGRQKCRSEKKEFSGACKKCGKNEPSEGRLYCRKCLDKVRRWNRANREKKRKEGRCFACGITCDTGTRCRTCHEKNMEQLKARRARAIEEGLCQDCNKPGQVSARTEKGFSQYCRTCYLKMMARCHLGSGRFWTVLLEKLEEAEWRCSYTGEKLILGENLSFDHDFPVSRFPERKHDPGNLHPCTLAVNLAKREMTREEFLTIVVRIYQHTNQG